MINRYQMNNEKRKEREGEMKKKEKRSFGVDPCLLVCSFASLLLLTEKRARENKRERIKRRICQNTFSFLFPLISFQFLFFFGSD